MNYDTYDICVHSYYFQSCVARLDYLKTRMVREVEFPLDYTLLGCGHCGLFYLLLLLLEFPRINWGL